MSSAAKAGRHKKMMIEAMTTTASQKCAWKLKPWKLRPLNTHTQRRHDDGGLSFKQKMMTTSTASLFENSMMAMQKNETTHNNQPKMIGTFWAHGGNWWWHPKLDDN